ncbi:MAG: hypothetical protein ACP5OK_07070 [Thermoprotei archaeon]
MVTCRRSLLRISEKVASKILGKIVGVKDFYSNYRVYKRSVLESIRNVSLDETFGEEFLIRA